MIPTPRTPADGTPQLEDLQRKLAAERHESATWMQRVQEEKDRINQLRATLRKDVPARSPVAHTPMRMAALQDGEGEGSVQSDRRSSSCASAIDSSEPAGATPLSVQLEFGTESFETRTAEAPQRAEKRAQAPSPARRTPSARPADVRAADAALLADGFTAAMFAFATAALGVFVLAVAESISGHVLRGVGLTVLAVACILAAFGASRFEARYRERNGALALC